MKTLYTNEKLFNVILGILRRKNLLPNILNCCFADSWEIMDIRDFDWDVIGCFDFCTDNETFMNIYAKGETGNDVKEVRLGCFGIKDKSREAFYTLSKLQVDFFIETKEFVKKHINDFDWTDTP